jgi:hypothetical protein
MAVHIDEAGRDNLPRQVKDLERPGLSPDFAQRTAHVLDDAVLDQDVPDLIDPLRRIDNSAAPEKE